MAHHEQQVDTVSCIYPTGQEPTRSFKDSDPSTWFAEQDIALPQIIQGNKTSKHCHWQSPTFSEEEVTDFGPCV